MGEGTGGVVDIFCFSWGVLYVYISDIQCLTAVLRLFLAFLAPEGLILRYFMWLRRVLQGGSGGGMKIFLRRMAVIYIKLC